MSANPSNLALEPAAAEFVEAASKPPFLCQLPPEERQKAVGHVQTARSTSRRSTKSGSRSPVARQARVKVRAVKPVEAQSRPPDPVRPRRGLGVRGRPKPRPARPGSGSRCQSRRTQAEK